MHSSSAQRLATVVIGDTIIVLLLHDTPVFQVYRSYGGGVARTPTCDQSARESLFHDLSTNQSNTVFIMSLKVSLLFVGVPHLELPRD